MATKKQDYDLAFTHIQNNQNISAYNLFLNLAESQKKTSPFKAGLLYVLAAECKIRQGKDENDELLNAAKLFLNFAKKGNDYSVKSAYLCASKCFLKSGKYDDAKKAYNKSQELLLVESSTERPIVVVDDSKAILLKLETYLQKLGYNDIHSFGTGKDAIKGCKDLIKNSQNPIVLLDMGLPDVDGNFVANKILEEKLDLQIILITADEKTSKRVNETISSGVTAFIQKPFTINDVKKAIELAEIES